MRVLTVGLYVGDQLQATLLHAAGGEETIAHALELVGATSQDNHLEAVVVIEVDVERRAHLFAKLVLRCGQTFGELADMVIVDERKRAGGRHAARELYARNLGARQIAQKLGACDPARRHQGIETLEERPLHRDAEADEIVFHGERD